MTCHCPPAVCSVPVARILTGTSTAPPLPCLRRQRVAPILWVGGGHDLGTGRYRRHWTAPVFRVPDRLSVGGRSTRGAASLRGDVPGPDPRGARPPTRREGPLTTRASLLPLGTDISPLGRKYDHLGPADLGGSDEPVCHRALETSVARACVGQEEKCMQNSCQDGKKKCMQTARGRVGPASLHGGDEVFRVRRRGRGRYSGPSSFASATAAHFSRRNALRR